MSRIIEFSKQYNTNLNSFWKKDIFSDECKFELFSMNTKERY